MSDLLARLCPMHGGTATSQNCIACTRMSPKSWPTRVVLRWCGGGKS